MSENQLHDQKHYAITSNDNLGFLRHYWSNKQICDIAYVQKFVKQEVNIE